MPARALAPRFELRPYRLRLAQPLRTARGVMESRQGYLVLAHEGGLVGRGEALGLPEEFPDSPAARFAMELALLDLQAQRAGVPLARLLDPRAVLQIPTGALLCAESMPELAREVRRATAEGYSTLKLKVGTQDDYARAAVVRDAAGPSVKLRLDANGAWDAPAALRNLGELAALGIELCEQPTEDLRDLAGSLVPVAADELVASDAEAALSRAQIVVLKPMALGGVLPALQLARRAVQRGLQVIVTTSLEGAVGRAGAAHLAAAVLALGPQPAAGLATGRLLAEDLCADPLAPRSGVVRIPDKPGLL